MVKRAKLVNDIVELVPILQIFSINLYRNVYDALLREWLTFDELKERFGEGVEEALKILKHAGMLDVKWRMPVEPKDKPEKEYHVSYTHLSANFYASLKDLNKILEVIFMPDDEFEEYVQKIMDEIRAGRKSVPHICKSLGLDPLIVRGIAKKSLKLNIKGQLVEFAKDEEI
ncbi:ArsR family transcriptional regulator [Archaeoglobales archaeon]|nr:MAG: ArsR family transcriptional regulator [Archaeoglobales archaeon]